MSQLQAANADQGLRVKLRIVEAALAVVPWELLYDTRFGEFVALDQLRDAARVMALTAAAWCGSA